MVIKRLLNEMRILLIDDDWGISRALVRALSESYTVDAVTTAAAGLAAVERHSPDLILLDLNLPDMNGLKLCKRFRENGVEVPILILSGETKTTSKITLLDAGANDYVTKPFSLGELKARMRVLLRHKPGTVEKAPAAPSQFTVDDLTLYTDRQQVKRGGQIIHLRRKEYALLECLMRHAGNVVTRDTLTAYAWRPNEDPWTNTVDVHIKYLRDKVDRPFERQLIKTVHGLGYKLEASQPVAKI